jgi:hypothetical protein
MDIIAKKLFSLNHVSWKQMTIKTANIHTVDERDSIYVTNIGRITIYASLKSAVYVVDFV